MTGLTNEYGAGPGGAACIPALAGGPLLRLMLAREDMDWLRESVGACRSCAHCEAGDLELSCENSAGVFHTPSGKGGLK